MSHDMVSNPQIQTLISKNWNIVEILEIVLSRGLCRECGRQQYCFVVGMIPENSTKQLLGVITS